MSIEEHKKRVQEYIDFCVAPDSIVSIWVRKLCQMHMDDMGRVDDDGFPFYFDVEAVEHVFRVFEMLCLSDAKWYGKKFELLRWQRLVIWMAYGWKWKTSKQRRYVKIFIKVARKNGKTQFLAAIGTYGQSFDPYEKGCQIWWFATKKEQAKIGFEAQQGMARLLCQKSPMMAGELRVMQYRIQDRNGNGYTSYLGKNSKGEDGFNPFYGICDEYHAHVTDDMMGVVESGMIARDSPMTWIITTAGVLIDGPCVQFEKKCKQILDGIDQDTEVLPLIFDLDPEDDWEDENNWSKANPALGESLKIENIRRDFRKAKNGGIAGRLNFMTKNLNIYQKSNQVWIPGKTWMANSGERDREQLILEMKGRLCFGGLDLASTRDLCSLVLLFPPRSEEEKWVVIQWSWAPEASIDERIKVDAVPYRQFMERGELITTPGRTTDYNVIKEKVLWAAETYELHSVAYDRYNSYQVIPQIEEYGILMEAYNQSFPSMSAPTQTVEMLATNLCLDHGGDTLLGWAVSNVVIEKKDDLVKPSKKRSPEKIDPVVSLVMAMGQANEYMHEVTAGSDWSPMVIIGLR